MHRVHGETWDYLKHWFSWSILQTHFHRQVPAVTWEARKLVRRFVYGKGGRGRRGEEGRKKKEHSQSSQILHLSLHSPLPSPRTAYFLTALARAMVLTHVQSSVHKFRDFFFQNLSLNSYRLPLISQALFPEHISKIHTFLVTRE